MGISQLGIATIPRLLAVEVLLSEPEALEDDVLETCLYFLRDRLQGRPATTHEATTLATTRRCRVSRPFTATAAIETRMRQLGMSPGDLASAAGVPETTLRYFGLLSHDPQTLERLSAALGWPRDHVARLWDASLRPLP